MLLCWFSRFFPKSVSSTQTSLLIPKFLYPTGYQASSAQKISDYLNFNKSKNEHIYFDPKHRPPSTEYGFISTQLSPLNLSLTPPSYKNNIQAPSDLCRLPASSRSSLSNSSLIIYPTPSPQFLKNLLPFLQWFSLCCLGSFTPAPRSWKILSSPQCPGS